MTKIDKKTCQDIRFLLMVSICCIFTWIGSGQVCQAQDHNSPVVLSFVKANDSIKTSEMYFNILKIRNTSTRAITGTVSFKGPEKWEVISFSDNGTTLPPGDSISVPFRVSPTADALGGITYIISASFKTKERQVTSNTYLTLPSKPKWEFSTNKNNLYFTQNSNFASFDVKLSNKGNTNELIKLHLKIGKLLMFPNNNSDEITEFVNLPAFRDTTLTHSVTYQKKLSYAEKIRYENNWKESSLQATASCDKKEINSTLMFHQLNSTYAIQRMQNASPLNFDYQIYNLMSNQKPSSNLRVYGSVLFPDKRQFDYMLGMQNIDFGGVNNIDFNSQLFYSLRYIDKRNNIELGYNVNGGSLHTINGRGINGSFRINSNNILSYAITQNPYNNTTGGFLGYTTSVKGIGFNTGLTHESSTIAGYVANSGLIGTGFSLFRHHTFSFEVLGSQSRYNLVPGKDTTVQGYSYKIDYSVRYKKFNLSLSDLNSTHNYIRNSGQQQIYLDSKYMLSDRVVFSFYGNHQDYATTFYPFNFYHPSNINSTDYARFTTTISSGTIDYQIGPNYLGSGRKLFNSLTGYITDYQTYQPGIWGGTTFRLNGYRSITPNITVSNLRFYYKSNDPASQNYSSDKNIYYSVGINYFDTNFRMNAYYSSGSVSDLYRSVQIDVAPVVSSSIQVRPSYENFFFNRTVKLSAYMNYAYYMPSGRENVSYNLKYDQFLKHGWIFSVSGFMYTNTVVDKDQGRIDTKDLNLMVGISKSFNIQQPRLKYYNLRTVFFNDLDGNHIKSDNEPPVSNIMVNIEKDRTVSTGRSYIPETQLLSDENGGIYIENLPKDNYKLSFTPLVNLQNLYFLNGETQAYLNDKDRILYVPLAESYRIKGKIIVVRDPNSTDGKIDLSGIRLTATGVKGETYSALTDNSGGYVINVPKGDKFKVHVNNVFGENYNIDMDELEVQFTQNKAINLDFTFIEKQRGVSFEAGNELFKFNSIGSSESEKTDTVKTGQQVKKANEVVPPSYAIQLGALKSYRDPAYFKNKYKLTEEVLYLEENGLFKYFTGTFPSLKEAKAKIAKLGYPGLIGVAVDRTLLMQGRPVAVPAVPVQAAEDKSGVKKPNSDTGNKTAITQPVKPINTQPVKPVVTEPAKAVNTSEEQQVPVGKPLNQKPLKTTKNTTIDKPLSYSIQLDSGKIYRDPSYYKTKFRLKDEVLYLEKDGMFKYFTGVYPTMEAARADMNKSRITGRPVAIDRILLKSAKPVETAKTTGSQPVDAKNNQNTKSPAVTPKDSKPAVLSNNGTQPVKPQPKEVQQIPNGFTYSVQIDVSKTFVDPSLYKIKYNLPDEVLWEEKEGMFRYYTGSYATENAAHADILKYGLAGYIVLVDRSKLKKGNTYEKKNSYSIQLEVSAKYISPLLNKSKYNIKGEVLYFERGSQYIYVTGNYPTIEKAKAEMLKLGIKGTVIPVDISTLKVNQ